MKLVDKFVNKIGYSNLLHVLISALITAYGGMFAFPGIFIGAALALLIGIGKEKLDNTFDMADFRYDLIGTTLSVFVWVIVYLL